jgi:hypothetical protein
VGKFLANLCDYIEQCKYTRMPGRTFYAQTNNPRKIRQLEGLGIKIAGRVPCMVQEANPHNVVRCLS